MGIPVKKHTKWHFHTVTLIAGVALLLVLFISSAYFFVIPDPSMNAGHPQIASRLDDATALWQERQPSHYRYVVERVCFCTPDYRRPYRVTIDGNGPDFSFMGPVDAGGPGATSPPEPFTIADLLTLLQRGVTEADAVEVAFDSRFGYPTHLRIDWSQQMADEEQEFYVRDFEVLTYR